LFVASVHAFLVSHLIITDDRIQYGAFCYKEGTDIDGHGVKIKKVSGGWYLRPFLSFNEMDRK
jgi:hypothetical protein